MPALKIDQMGGMLPAWSDLLLSKGQAAYARDCYLFSGELIGWRKPKLLRTLTNGAARTVFRIPTGTDDTVLGASAWLEFTDHETTVVRSQVVDDQYERYYWASPSDVPRYNTKARIINGDPAWKLGLNPPGCQPIITPSGGGNETSLGFPNPTLTGAADVDARASYIYLVPITAPGAIEVNDVQFIPNANAPTAIMQGVLYTDNGGTPDNLLAVGAAQQGATAAVKVTSSFLYPQGLLDGAKYWVGVATDTELFLTASDDVGQHGYTLAYTSGVPTNAAGGTGNQPTPQMWAGSTTSAQLEDRAYVYTWVTEYGEESVPSPATNAIGWDNGTWQVDLYSPDANDMGVDRNITKVRVYRTIPGATGQTVFYLVQEVAVGTASITDSATSDVISLNSLLASTTWFPPPTDLQQLVQMPNGMTVGFRANEIWFCEPYRPHAWPPGYVLTTEFPIVGLGVTGSAVIACTTSTPYMASGPNPPDMTLMKVPVPEPCIARGSIMGRDDGVLYCSPYGLIRVTSAGTASNTTDAWVTRDKWTQYTPSKYIDAVQIASCYVAFGTARDGDTTQAQKGFSIELNSDVQSFTIWPQPGGHRIGFTTMTSPLGYDIYSFVQDPWSGVALMIMNGGVYYYDFTDTAPDLTTYKWRSKKYQQNAKQNFQAMKVFFTVPVTTPAQGTRSTAPTDDASWNTLGTGQYGIIRVYADDQLVTVREIYKSGELLRILSDFKCDIWQFEVEARVQISNIQVATSVKELART